MKLSRLVPLYENVFQIIDMSMKAANVKQTGNGDADLSYDEAVKLMAILVGFMLADKATMDDHDLLKRSYAPIGILYRASVKDTKAALIQFWSALGKRPLEFGSRDIKTMIQKYHKFLQHGDHEQWKNVLGQLRAYFIDREAAVRQEEAKEPSSPTPA